MSDICPECARRAWLLAKLNVRLDFRARDLSRFWSLLELSDLDLIDALGGRRRAELHAAHAGWELPQQDIDEHVERICRHHRAYPSSMREDPLGPPTLSVHGSTKRLAGIFDGRIAAIVGTRQASDYGMEVARELGRGLAAAGVIVASGLAEGIPAAAHSGALEAQGKALTVMGGGVERCSPAWCVPLYRRIVQSGCAISEIHRGQRPHLWWQQARARTIALLAELVIVVEADDQPWELACAHVAWSRGRHVAAVPGRVSSPSSRGTNSLLMSGAGLVRDAQDALNLLYGLDAREIDDMGSELVRLEPRLARVLGRVGDGEDTIEKLVSRGANSSEIALTLLELELRGMLVRGDGGRYVPSARASVR
jgi:DNA processing protein